MGRLYERGLTFVGKDYLCNTLWDQYLAFEHSHKQWNRLVGVYIKSLRFPTKKLHSYYQRYDSYVLTIISSFNNYILYFEKCLLSDPSASRSLLPAWKKKLNIKIFGWI